MSYDENTNKVYLRGEVSSEISLTHSFFSEEFYELTLKVSRLSGADDYIPITISNRLFSIGDLEIGNTITVIGQFRSHNLLENGRSKLKLSVFVQRLCENDFTKNSNVIALCGYICKEPNYRVTPFNKEITDMLMAVNRSYNKSDYIPCILWGRNAKYANTKFVVGDMCGIFGRIQSRTYVKRCEDNEIEERVAYEISVAKIAENDDIGTLFDYFEQNIA